MSEKNNFDIVTGFIMDNRDPIYRLAYSYVHDKDDALDIIQDSICKALSSMKSLKNPMLVKPWFFRIIVNTALDFLRKNKKYLYLDADTLEALAPGSTDEYHDFELQKAIEKLSTINKTIIVLRFYKDFKLEEISIILNENINTIKTKLYSSLKKLRIELEERDKCIDIVNNDE
jgi:RNA polymerase sigma-70 factor (ECF subfamily)